MAPDTDTPYNPGYRCPDCGTALMLIQRASQRRSATSRRHSFGYRRELWGCPRRGDADHHPWRGRYGWLEWAPEIQPPAPSRPAVRAIDLLTRMPSYWSATLGCRVTVPEDDERPDELDG